MSSLRILADHGRAMTVLVSDGVLPSNEGRGYVLRRIIRRAVLAARRLGREAAVTTSLTDAAVEMLGAAYPEAGRGSRPHRVGGEPRRGRLRPHPSKPG